MNNENAGWLAAIALLGTTGGSLLGGFCADPIARNTADRYCARRRLCAIAYSLAACFLFRQRAKRCAAAFSHLLRLRLSGDVLSIANMVGRRVRGERQTHRRDVRLAQRQRRRRRDPLAIFLGGFRRLA